MLKLPFEMLTCDTVTLADPEFVSVKLWFAFEPTGTFPNPTLNGFAERSPTEGLGPGEDALVNPEQPATPEMMMQATMAKASFGIALRWLAKRVVDATRCVSMRDPF